MVFRYFRIVPYAGITCWGEWHQEFTFLTNQPCLKSNTDLIVSKSDSVNSLSQDLMISSQSIGKKLWTMKENILLTDFLKLLMNNRIKIKNVIWQYRIKQIFSIHDRIYLSFKLSSRYLYQLAHLVSHNVSAVVLLNLYKNSAVDLLHL